jgi:hypothetical protein
VPNGWPDAPPRGLRVDVCAPLAYARVICELESRSWSASCCLPLVMATTALRMRAPERMPGASRTRGPASTRARAPMPARQKRTRAPVRCAARWCAPPPKSAARRPVPEAIDVRRATRARPYGVMAPRTAARPASAAPTGSTPRAERRGSVGSDRAGHPQTARTETRAARSEKMRRRVCRAAELCAPSERR